MGLMWTLVIWVANANNEFIVHDTIIWTITVYSQDKSYWITIQDKNLWASVVWTWESSYWDFYQWWNNHGNPAWTNTWTLNELLEANVNERVNKWYSGENDKFIIFNNWNKNTRDYRSGVYFDSVTDNSYTWESAYNNLWWGENDNDDNDATIVKWYDTSGHVATNVDNRQWPCPEGYHVPSAWEWQELMMLRCNANSGTCNNTAIREYQRANYLSKSGIWTAFSNDLELPLAGFRSYDDGAIYVQGYGVRYWSSSPCGGSNPESAWALYFSFDSINPSYSYYRAFGHSLRCFKNEYIEPPVNMDIVLEATSTEANQTLKINKYFANAYTVDRWDGTTWNLTADITHTYATAGTYPITLSLSWADRWTFQNVSKPLVPQAGTTMTWVKVTYMPSLAEWFGESATSPWDNFFNAFNLIWAITILPAWSFDTSNITTVWNRFFASFNDRWALTKLPDGSFNTSNISWAVWDYFFSAFNGFWQLTSLPTNSFDTSNITTVWNEFFNYFNGFWQLTSLPINSFDTSSITTVGMDFFYYFNGNWALESLPEGSFDTSKITTAWDYFFCAFNAGWKLEDLPWWSFRLSTWLTTAWMNFFYKFNTDWALTSLPEWSFDISNIITVDSWFFSFFNRRWALNNLPEGSFNTKNITTVGDDYFISFNENWALTSLPEWSFKFSTWLTTIGNYFFYDFNLVWKLEDLPEWSFDTSHITTVGNFFFSDFNYGWQLTSLPEGSFDTRNITTAGNSFLSYFNYSWEITNLPDSFKMSSVWASVIWWYQKAFNSTWYTLNRKVSDLVSWVTAPLNDMNTFSDNQPWRCGVADNWLVNPATACKTVTFETNSWSLVDSQIVDIDANEMVIKPTDPTKTWHTFTGWYSDENLTELFDFSTVITDDTTLYAKWQVNQYTITLDIDWTLTVITWDYGSPVDKPANPTKNWYKFIGWEPEIPDTMPAENMTVKAKWERNWSSGWWGWGGWWWSSSISSTGSNATTGSDNSNNTWNQQTWSGANSSTGNQNEQPTSWTKIKEPEANTGNNIQTWNQEDNPLEDSQSDKHDVEDSQLAEQASTNTSEWQTYTPEFQQAYEFAKWYWITTMSTIQKADMDGKLTRIAMAKMLSQYAINILWKTPDTTQNNKFNDVTDKQNSDYDNGVTLAYQLWIMWQNMPNNNFRPNDEVTRAEFATALSRMIYWTSDWEYKWTWKYYIHHMEKLVEEWIITKDDPRMKELRWYVMIMLMRSAK